MSLINSYSNFGKNSDIFMLSHHMISSI